MYVFFIRLNNVRIFPRALTNTIYLVMSWLYSTSRHGSTARHGEVGGGRSCGRKLSAAGSGLGRPAMSSDDEPTGSGPPPAPPVTAAAIPPASAGGGSAGSALVATRPPPLPPRSLPTREASETCSARVNFLPASYSSIVHPSCARKSRCLSLVMR